MLDKIQAHSLFQRIVFALGPLVLTGLLIYAPEGEVKLYAVYGVALWMILWWVAEVVPIHITAIIPTLLFPVFGVFTVEQTILPYISPIIFLFLGGFIIALAVEERKVHLRLAIHILQLTGTKPRGIILGFSIATAFLSMWISNTATAVMMLPIALSVTELLSETGDSERKYKFSLALLLAIAYSANIGGTMTIIGTPPNVVYAGFLESRYGIDLNFASWMIVGVPSGIIILCTMYFVLTRLWVPKTATDVGGGEDLLREQKEKLGPMKKAEKLILGVFLFTALLWSIQGSINEMLAYKLLNNMRVALLGGFLMFVIPLDLKRGEFLLPIKSSLKLPWFILILFAGGLSLAAALDQAGVVTAIGAFVSDLVGSQIMIMTVVLVFVCIFATEVMSNVALVSILIPLVLGISDSLGVSPYHFAVPVTLAASCAFMLPISTPPNAVVYSSGMIKTPSMMKVGIWLNIASVAVLSWLVPYLTMLVF